LIYCNLAILLKNLPLHTNTDYFPQYHFTHLKLYYYWIKWEVYKWISSLRIIQQHNSLKKLITICL